LISIRRPNIVITLLFLPLSTLASQCVTEKSVSSINNKALLNYLKILSSNDFSGRKFSTPGNKLAQNYIVSTLERLSIPAFKGAYQHPFSQELWFSTKQGANVIALIEGKKHPERYIILSAHYDHLGNKGHKIFNGADDNASGTAALLSYADLLIKNPLNHSVILLFTDGEETNLLGAKAFVSEQKTMLPKIKLNINIDMIAGSKQTKVLGYISHDFEQILSSAMQEKLLTCQKELPLKIKKGFNRAKGRNSILAKTNWRMASDHAVFYQNNIPFIYFGVGTHKNYHSVNDNYENINTEFFIDATSAIYQQLLFIDKNITSKAL
jgi:Zn-dependent M28 family amino/carboxypeptidase